MPSTSCNHTCSARAVEQCRALVWEYSRLQALLNQYPQIRKNINQILASRLGELEERFEDVHRVIGCENNRCQAVCGFTCKVSPRTAATSTSLPASIGPRSPMSFGTSGGSDGANRRKKSSELWRGHAIHQDEAGD